MSEWISVEDRLPETESTILIVSSHYCEIPMSMTAYHDGDNFIEVLGDQLVVIESDQVSHWMPLPEPPKGES